MQNRSNVRVREMERSSSSSANFGHDQHSYKRGSFQDSLIVGHLDPSDEHKTRLASVWLTRGLLSVERRIVNVESGSVYGAAILMPQVARSAQWKIDFFGMVVASYAFLFFTVMLHGCLLTFIAKEGKVMKSFSGLMSLCDFGAWLSTNECGEDDGSCIGPFGTRMVPPRLYSWPQYIVRSFLRDSLKGIFPDRADDIQTHADPGEYGLESYHCRFVCLIIFMLAVISEIILCVDMCRLLWWTPNYNESWIEVKKEFDHPADLLLLERSDNQSWIEFLTEPFSSGAPMPERYLAEECLNHIDVKVSGMSFLWKFINVVCVFIPKTCLVFLTAKEGVVFLMETAGIDDMILNSLALFLLLQIDNLIMKGLASTGANKLLEICEGLPMLTQAQHEQKMVDAAETVHEYIQTRHATAFILGLIYEVVFVQLWKFFTVFLLVAFLACHYYWEHCDYIGGQFVSKAVYYPKSMDYNFLNALLGNWMPIQQEETAYWSMPLLRPSKK